MKTPEQAIAQLLRLGAMMTPTLGSPPVLTTILRPAGRDRWFWWAAGGDTEFDGHLVEADQVAVHYDGAGVEFRRAGEFAGYLTTIEEALDDETAVDRARTAMAEWRARYDSDEALRGFIERAARRAAT